MIIYTKNGTVLLDISVEDTSYRYRAIRQGDKVYLYFSLTEHVEIPVYSYIEYAGQRYTLWKPENLTKQGERNIEYIVEFGGWWEMLNRTRYKLLASKPHKIKFPLTATPRLFLQLLVDNLNLHDSGWSVGTCVEATEKAMSFNNESCMAVLNRFADEFNTEFEFINKTVNFGKVERFKNDPLALAYGKGNGFKTGVGRQNQGDKAPVTILYVQGGERNIDTSTYKSSTLLLPKSQELEYQGRRYKTDPDGMFVIRADRELVEYNEDSYDGSKFYPSRVGTISEVIAVNVDKHFYDIKDSSIPESLDYSKYRIAGEKAVIIFQSGIMEGKEFEIEQTDSALTGYIHAERRFKIVPEQKDGIVMPDQSFCPEVGDKYAIFNIALPDAYVCDNNTKTGASWDMFREAVQYMYENEEQNFTFKGELDGIWSKKKWYEIGSKITPGGYVLFSDTQFQKDGLLIRITGVKDYINKPHAPELELSNTPVSGFVSSDLGKLEAEEVKNDKKHKEGLSFTKRRYRDAEQSLSLIQEAVKGYSEGINPIWVKSMAALFGDEALQFNFVNSKTNPETVGSGITYSDTTKIFSAPAGIIKHMSLGINSLSPYHAPEEFKYWDMAAYISPPLDENLAMYVYAKCSKTSVDGAFLLTKTAMDFDNSDGNYYFLIGTLSDEYDGVRSYIECYGFTEVLPGRITLWKIVDPDGFQFWDMQNRAFRIGDPNNYLAYNEDGLRRLMLKGILVQSPSGDTAPLGVLVGAYSATRQYYVGDEVTYSGSTYRCKVNARGVAPTNASYWTVIAQRGNDGVGKDGTPGKDGTGSRSVYYPSTTTSAPSTPPGTGAGTPSGWWTYPSYPSNSYTCLFVSTSTYDGESWSVWSIPTLYAQKGIPGSLPTIRQWRQGDTYVRNNAIVDYVIYRTSPTATPTWWRLKEGYTSVVAGSSPNATYFEQISSYEAIATTVLLAEEANLAGFVFKQGWLLSNNGVNPKLRINGSTGDIEAQNGRFFGTVGTPFKNIESKALNVYLDLDQGANYISSVGNGVDQILRLPVNAKYSGVRCYFYLPLRTRIPGSCTIKTADNSWIQIPSDGIEAYQVSEVPLSGMCMVAEFICVAIHDDSVIWTCQNYKDII